jgi:hypothetical protein
VRVIVMDDITHAMIANVQRMNELARCQDICGGFECYGWCRPPILFPTPESVHVEHAPTVEPEVAEPPTASTNVTPTATAEDPSPIAVTIYKPSQLYIESDPAKGFKPRTTGTPCNTTWEQLVRVLSRAPEGDPKKYRDPNVQKSARGGWSACALKEGRRLASAFIETRLLGLDIDKNGDIERVLKAFEPFKKIVHSTYKSTKDAPRCRVVLLLKEACRDADAFRRAHRVVRETVVRGGWFDAKDFDDAGSDPSRLWFLPMVPPFVPYVFHVTDGALLDVSKLVPKLAASNPIVRKTTPKFTATHKTSPNGAGALAWADRKMHEAAEGQRHTTVYSTAAWLAAIDPPIPDPQIASALMPHAPVGREAEFRRTIADAIQRGRAA